MARYQLLIEYVGTKFKGWQIQKEGPTIQGLIQEKLKKLLKEEIILNGSGRTDAGVHAKQMFAHFDMEHDFDKTNFCRSLNMMIPKDICVECLFLVNKDSHARFDALSRTYEYYISSEKDPFNFKFSYFFRDKLDIDKMNKSCERLIKHKNFL